MKSITIIGAGQVGLTLAALLSKNNFKVAIVESKQPDFNFNEPTARVSTIHLISQKILAHVGAWENIAIKTPVAKMHIWDHTQKAVIDFDAHDMHCDQMAWVIENRAIIHVLQKHLNQDENVTFYCPRTPKKYDRTTKELILDNDEKIKSDLIVGADGAHSWVRAQMNIDVQEKSYDQKAITAVIESEKPHENTAIQKFLTTGPAALLPLSNPYHTALVWSADDAISDALMQKSDEDFSHALTDALDHRLGKLKTISARAQFPLTMRHATEYATDHFALVGDAAHTIHPLAGLGVNLGLLDAACLTDTLINKKTLRGYTRSAKSNNATLIAAMRVLQTTFAFDQAILNTARSVGINLLNKCTPVKKYLMQLAMGQLNDLPGFLQENAG